MADGVLRGSVVIDTSGLERLSEASRATESDIQRLQTQFVASGLTSEEASVAIKNLGLSTAGLGDAAAAAAPKVSSLDRAIQTAGSRLAVTELGLGRMGLALGRVGLAAGVLGPIMEAAFPVIAIVGILDLIDTVAEKINAARNKTLDAAIAWETLDHSQIMFEDHLDKGITAADAKIEHFTKLSLGQMDDEIKQITVDTDSLFAHFTSMLSKFDEDQKKYSKGILMQLISGEGGTDEVTDLSKHVQLALATALNGGDVKAAHEALSAGLQQIKQREEELAGISGSADRLKQYRELATILKGQREDLDKAVELQQKLTAGEAAEVDFALRKKTHEEGMEYSKKAAEEELEGITRNNEETKKTFEDGLKYSKEKAEEELEQIERVKAANIKAADDEQKARKDQMEGIERAGEAEIETARRAAETKIELQEKHPMAGGAAQTITRTSQGEQDKLSAMIELEKQYQAAVMASTLAQDKKGAAVDASMTKQIQLQKQLDDAQLKEAQQLQSLAQKQQAELGRMTNALNQNLLQWIDGNERAGQAFQRVWANAANSFISAMIKTGEQMLVNAIKQEAILSGTQVKAAASAASNTYASVSAIPMIGWLLAPPAAAAAFAAVLAFEEGGMVPRTGLVMAHEGEGILPRNLTTMLQTAANDGTGAGGGGGDFHMHATIHAVDASGVKAMLDNHSKVFAAAAMSHMRRRR